MNRRSLGWTPLLAAVLAGCVGNEPTAISARALTDERADAQTQCVTLYVRGNAKPAGNGSAKAPFTDLETAVAVAGKIPCDVVVKLGPGTYELGEKPLVISRPISITGQGKPTIVGSIIVQTKGLVALSHLNISGGAQKETKALFVDGKGGQGGGFGGADLVLFDVGFLRTLGFGLFQEGGTLSAEHVEFSDIEPAFNAASGTAVYVAAGAHASLRWLQIRNNVHALFATGAGTTVFAEHLFITHSSGLHPAALARITDGCSAIPAVNFGAMEFTDGASGSGTDWVMLSTGVIGLYAHHLATVNATNVQIDSTTWVGPSETVTCGGFGLGAFFGGQMEIRNFTVSHSQLCGVVVGSAEGVDPFLTGATALDLHDGNIKVAPIGACVMIADYDSGRLRDHVLYIDVDIPLQALSYSLPDALP